MSEKILLVDDDPDTLKYLSLFVKKLGYQPLEAIDGPTALKLAGEEQPDLIILDVMMPGMDGFEVARLLRRQTATATIPILMFTAKSQVEDKLAGYEAGVDIYLTKPIHPVELQANIKALLARRQVAAPSSATKERGYLLGVVAARGGLGVSTLALNLAIAYHQRQREKVIAVETRPGHSAWREELGYATAPAGLEELLQLPPLELNAQQVEKRLTPTPFGVPLLLASAEIAQGEHLQSAVEQLELLVERVAELARLVVVDIGTPYHSAYGTLTRLCDGMILVVEPQLLSVRRSRALVDDLKGRGFGSIRPLWVVTLNRVRAEITLVVRQIEEMLAHPVTLGLPPAPELAYLSATRATPMVLAQPEGVIARQFEALAEKIAEGVELKR